MTATPLRWMPAKAFGGLFKPPAATFIVVHCTESDNGAGTAESLAGPNWFGGSKAGTSAHRIFDRDSGVEMVRASTVAYHAGPGGNTWGRSYEFCGRASWTAAQWRAPEQLNMLRLAAPHMAQDLIEITGSRAAARDAARWLSVVQVAQHAHGLCTHNDIRLAFPGTTTHSDPGPNFPYAELLAYVRAELGDVPTPATSEEDDDMPQAVAAQIPATNEPVVFAFPPSGPGAAGGAAHWGQGWLDLVADRGGQPGGDIRARIGIRGANDVWRPAFGRDWYTVLPAGSRGVIALQPGDNAVVFSETNGPIGACVEYAKA